MRLKANLPILQISGVFSIKTKSLSPFRDLSGSLSALCVLVSVLKIVLCSFGYKIIHTLLGFPGPRTEGGGLVLRDRKLSQTPGGSRDLL